MDRLYGCSFINRKADLAVKNSETSRTAVLCAIRNPGEYFALVVKSSQDAVLSRGFGLTRRE